LRKTSRRTRKRVEEKKTTSECFAEKGINNNKMHTGGKLSHYEKGPQIGGMGKPQKRRETSKIQSFREKKLK